PTNRAGSRAVLTGVTGITEATGVTEVVVLAGRLRAADGPCRQGRPRRGAHELRDGELDRLVAVLGLDDQLRAIARRTDAGRDPAARSDGVGELDDLLTSHHTIAVGHEGHAPTHHPSGCLAQLGQQSGELFQTS